MRRQSAPPRPTARHSNHHHASSSHDEVGLVATNQPCQLLANFLIVVATRPSRSIHHSDTIVLVASRPVIQVSRCIATNASKFAHHVHGAQHTPNFGFLAQNQPLDVKSKTKMNLKIRATCWRWEGHEIWEKDYLGILEDTSFRESFHGAYKLRNYQFHELLSLFVYAFLVPSLLITLY